MKYIRLTPRLAKIIGLETFVFATFIGICALINAVIVGIPAEPNPIGIAFLKVGISLLLVGAWLFLWFYLTRRIMKSKEVPEENRNEEKKLS